VAQGNNDDEKDLLLLLTIYLFIFWLSWSSTDVHYYNIVFLPSNYQNNVCEPLMVDQAWQSQPKMIKINFI